MLVPLPDNNTFNVQTHNLVQMCPEVDFFKGV
jgi:hypothetical protein